MHQILTSMFEAWASAKEFEAIVNVARSEFSWKVDALTESIIRIESPHHVDPGRGICY